jgi:hypothetical protein
MFDFGLINNLLKSLLNHFTKQMNWEIQLQFSSRCFLNSLCNLSRPKCTTFDQYFAFPQLPVEATSESHRMMCDMRFKVIDSEILVQHAQTDLLVSY